MCDDRLTKQMAISVAMGTVKQINATLRHAVKLPNRNTRNRPSVAAMPAIAINMPRMDGWLVRYNNNIISDEL